MMTRRGGFTIIEVTLVMAITGVLAVVLIVGWTTNVNTQSYKDGINSLVSRLQMQYDDVYNTSNDRNKSLTCGAGLSYDDTATTSNQGSSECVVLGQYILFSDSTMKSRRIVGIETDLVSTDNDIQAIKDYQPQTVSDTIETANTYELPWGITLYKPNDPAKLPLYKAVVIVRSPRSGVVYTYNLDTVSGDEPTVMNVLSSGSTAKQTLCLRAANHVSSTPMAVTIASDASTHESISTLSQEGGNQCAS